MFHRVKGHANELHSDTYDIIWIEGDVDGDVTADFALALTGVLAPVESDFVL